MKSTNIDMVFAVLKRHDNPVNPLIVSLAEEDYIEMQERITALETAADLGYCKSCHTWRQQNQKRVISGRASRDCKPSRPAWRNEMNFARAHDQYLTPPEEPEAVLCDDCGEEMTDDKSGTLVCYYQFCPAKFEGVAREMAELLIGAREEVESLARKLRMKG